MKKCRLFLCLLALVLLTFACAALAEGIPYDEVLTAQPWTSDTESELTFNADGTGRLVSTGVDTETSWTLDGATVTIFYQFYGERSVVYTLTAADGRWALASETNAAAYVGPAVEEKAPVEIELVPTEAPEPSEPEPTEAPEPSEPHARTPYGTTVLLGDGVYLETSETTFQEIGDTKIIYSNGTGEGEFAVREPSEERLSYYYVAGDFTNLLDHEVDIRNIYGEFFFDGGARVYKADFAPVVPEAVDFEYNIAPDSGAVKHYIFCEIPEEELEAYTSCVLKLGYTDEYDYKMAVNGAYQYSRLDDVFYVILKEDPLKEYSDRETIKALQTALNEAGFECGTPDGVAGRNTASAISAYQAANGLNETGTATFETITTLGIVPAMSY